MKFGDIVGMDYEPTLRLLALYRVDKDMQRLLRHEAWWALVLVDESRNPDAWETGRIVTVAPTVSGFRLIEEGP